MPWVSRKVQEDFTLLVNQLCAFQGKFGKKKYQLSMDVIASVCKNLVELMYLENKPKTADTMFSSLSGILQTHMNLITLAKKGKNHLQEFTRAHEDIVKHIAVFKNHYENDLRVEESNNNGIKIELIKQNEAQTDIDAVDTLIEKIKTLEIEPLRHFSMWSLFGHAAHYYPKTVVASAVGFTVSITSGGLYLLGRYAGESINHLLHAENDSGFNYQAAVSAGAAVVATVLAAKVLYTSRPKTVHRDTVHHDIEQGPSESANETTRLVRK